MLGYYDYDIYDYLEAVFAASVILALIAIPFVLSFGVK
jgi:hypothetical protein